MINSKPIIDYLTEHITDPVPKYILLKEILKEPETSPSYINVYNQMKQSKWYQELADEQWEDGSWGGFHSQDSKALKKQRFATTETALRRARELSLSKDDPIIAKCIALMERYVRGEETWTDRIEKHKDGGKSHLHSRPFITAANINLFDSENPVISPKREVFVNTLKIALLNDTFDEEAWEQENKSYSGPCLNGWNAYPIMILQNTNCMEDSLQRKYIEYLWHRKDGIYYLTDFPLSEKWNVENKSFHTWLTALRYFSGFSLFPEFMKDDVLPHLINECNRLIYDDIILPEPADNSIRYAESWRNKNTRKTDLILRIARIIVKC